MSSGAQVNLVTQEVLEDEKGRRALDPESGALASASPSRSHLIHVKRHTPTVHKWEGKLKRASELQADAGFYAATCPPLSHLESPPYQVATVASLYGGGLERLRDLPTAVKLPYGTSKRKTQVS